MDKVKITKSAYAIIEQESLKCGTETGGLLIGCFNNPIVIEATPPGRNAELGSCHFTADIEEDNLRLAYTIRKYNGKVSLMGYWHKHPGAMSQPSGGDLMQAQEIVKGMAQSGDKKPLLVFISNVISGNIKVYAYCIKSEATEFEPVQLTIVADNSDDVNCTLKSEPVVVQTKPSDYWLDPDFQFYLTIRGKERIKQELNELELAGYKAKALRRQSDNRLLLEVQKDNLFFIVIPPVEYPLGAPRIFDKHTENEMTGLTAICSWNSDYSIKTLLDGILKNNKQTDVTPIKEGGQNENHITKTLLRGTCDYARFVRQTINEYLRHNKVERGDNKHFARWE